MSDIDAVSVQFQYIFSGYSMKNEDILHNLFRPLVNALDLDMYVGGENGLQDY